MSRKNTRKAKSVPGSPGVMDEARTGEVTPVLPSGGGGGGGSVMGGLITETSFLPSLKPTYIDSPFGQRYLSSKVRAMTTYDVMSRFLLAAFDIQGYRDVGTFTSATLPAEIAGNTMLLDWYPLVRDMGKKSLKYKHLPLNLTDVNLPKKWMNTYYYVLVNLVVLLNLSRLGQFSPGFINCTQYLPRYMSRITRLYRRLSALVAPGFIKAHALRNGMIIWDPRLLSPVIRLWSPNFLPPAGADPVTQSGPTLVNINVSTYAMLIDNTLLGVFVENLEAAERWLEVGVSTNQTDFAAFKDLVDMTHDVVPGTWVPGLPEIKSLPGLILDRSLLTEYLCRAWFSKDDVSAGNDRWTMYPIPVGAYHNGRIPIMGYGTPSIYESILLGVPKYAHWNDSDNLNVEDVDSICRIPGTDFALRNVMNIQGAYTVADLFGQLATFADEILVLGDLSILGALRGLPCNDPVAIRDYEVVDGSETHHIWYTLRFTNRVGTNTVNAALIKKIRESGIDYVMWMEAADLGENYAEFLGKALGIPYLK